MATRAQKIRLGAFAIACAILLVIVLALFAGLRLWRQDTRYYVDVRGSALGLGVGARVLLNGVPIGSVEEMEVLPHRPEGVRITIEVEEGAPVRADTRAYLVYAGITGTKLIDLSGGTSAAPPLPPGSVIPTAPSTVDKLQNRIVALTDRVDETMDRLDTLLGNLNQITEPSQFAGMGEIVQRARIASRKLAAASGEVRALVRENRAALRESITAVGDAARALSFALDRQIEQLAGDAGALVADLRSIVRDNQSHIQTAMRDLRQASRNFKELARDLRNRPSRLLFSRPPEERKLP